MEYDPIVVVKDVLDKLNAEDWEGVAELCDEGSIYTFQRNLLWRFSDRPERDRTIEDYWRKSAGLPPEVAEFRIQQHRKHSDILARLREEIPHAGSVEELRNLSPRKLFAVWLQGQSTGTQVDRLVEVGGVTRARADKVLPSVIASWDYTLTACADERPRVRATVADSSGVRITLSPDVDDLYAHVDSQPSVSLGGADADGPEQFYNIQGVHVDSAGNIWVANRGSNELRIFRADGSHWKTIGRRGDGPGEFRQIRLLGPLVSAASHCGMMAILA